MDNGGGDGDDLGDGDDDDYDLPPFSSAASVFPSSCGWQPFNAAIFPPGGTGWHILYLYLAEIDSESNVFYFFLFYQFVKETGDVVVSSG